MKDLLQSLNEDKVKKILSDNGVEAPQKVEKLWPIKVTEGQTTEELHARREWFKGLFNYPYSKSVAESLYSDSSSLEMIERKEACKALGFLYAKVYKDLPVEVFNDTIWDLYDDLRDKATFSEILFLMMTSVEEHGKVKVKKILNQFE
tara:strand:- start:5855 stop:6298 length:444 start_codon:yes stop_codon:yes gene_type:complete